MQFLTNSSTLPLTYLVFPPLSLMAAAEAEAVTVATVTEAHHTHQWGVGQDLAVDPSTGVADDEVAAVVVVVTRVDSPGH